MTDPRPDIIITAAEACLQRNIPFALYSLPGSGGLRFMASLPDDEGRADACIATPGDCFFISRFGADESYVAGVRADMDAPGVMEWISEHPRQVFEPARELPYRHSTVRAGWERAFAAMRGRLRRHGGKVVLSRHTAVFSTRPLVPLAVSYISLTPANFGYLCFTPETGVWYGSTPELLLESEEPGRYRTMALAGTRWDPSQPWDAKNLAEHATVVTYIEHCLVEAGLDVSVGQVTTLTTNGVEHLYTPIEARGDATFGSLLGRLNPTPAVAGTPLEVALSEIDMLETHQRRCYAGAVGVRTGGATRAFVNLRCGFAAPAGDTIPGWIHNIYAGGGLMADSDPATEWEELDRKTRTLTGLIADGLTAPSLEFDPRHTPFTSLQVTPLQVTSLQATVKEQ